MSSNTASRRNWENSFTTWAQPPSETERQKCLNAENVIKNVIRTSSALKDRNIRVFAQGSYRNRTNVRSESDVDICVLCTDVGFTDFSFAPDLDDSKVGRIPATYEYSQFKDDVGKALASLGNGAVTRGNKAFDVHANTYRVDADVVPCFAHLRYTKDVQGKIHVVHGTEFIPDDGNKIINWPDQHYDNGVAKNDRTEKKFKAVTRILKNVKNEMKAAEIAEAQNVPSFLIECLVWNVPDLLLLGNNWTERVKSAMLVIHDQIQKGNHTEWGEVSELKYLFCGAQPWRPETATKFIGAAWNYLGF